MFDALARTLLRRSLQAAVRTGWLEVRLANGERFTCGDDTGERVALALTDDRAVWALIIDPALRTGELFMNGRLVMEAGTVYDFLMLALRHGDTLEPSWAERLLDGMRERLIGWSQRNDAANARRHVAHHYDIDDRLYALFLDPDWQYSCAYFEHPGQALADAQLAKKRHIAAKLALKPGSSVLDIGCGWGGMALYLAQQAGAGEVLGISLSENQVRRADARAAELALGDRVHFRLEDYRATTGRFDRLVSVGMFEHVGRSFYDEYFRVCRERLADDGVMLLHTIGSSDPPSFTNPWITKYIFPGGHLPSLSDIVAAVERSGLIITDVEVLRLHYAKTLRAWRDGFMARRAEAVALFDERFARMWEYYLAMSEAAFRCEHVVVFQLQLAARQEDAPLTRDPVFAAEQALRAKGA